MKIIINILAFTVIGKLAIASGFYTHSTSTSSFGSSFAGSTVGANDISESFNNPAIISDITDKQLIIGGTFLDINIDPDHTFSQYHNGTSVSGTMVDNAGVNPIIPSLYFASSINERLFYGIGITSPFGLATKYNDSWVGRYRAVETSIGSFNFNPIISYKINNKLSFGGGIQFQYTKVNLNKYLDLASHSLVGAPPGSFDGFTKVKGDDIGYGYNIGVKYKLNERTNLALSYRSKIEHKIKGSIQLSSAIPSFNLKSKMNFLLTTPEILSFGSSFKVNEKLKIFADINFTRWSRIKELNILAENSNLNDTTRFDWKDSFKYSVGANYDLTKKLQLRTGIAYEESAVVRKTLSPVLPIDDRVWLSAGFGYKIKDNLKIDLSYVHQIYRNNNTSNLQVDNSTNPPNTSIYSEYKTRVNVVSVGFVFSF